MFFVSIKETFVCMSYIFSDSIEKPCCNGNCFQYFEFFSVDMRASVLGTKYIFLEEILQVNICF